MTLFKHVPGENDEREVKMFAISTCAWCKRTKKLLKDLDIEYEYIDIDKLEGENKKEIYERLKEHNPSRSVPTLVINDGEKIIRGFKKEEIREALAND